MGVADKQAEPVNSSELLNLQTLAENRATFARSSLFQRVSGMLFETEGELKPEVRTLIDEILVGLIGQVEAEVRKTVAERICTLNSAPPTLTKMLANDEIDVARSVLQHSPVLTEHDLLGTIRNMSGDHRQAIARRAYVSAAVSAELAKRHEPNVIEALLDNAGAIIPRAVFNDLVALSQKVESIRRPLIRRPDLPKDMAYQMFWWVSAALRHVIIDQFRVEPAELDGLLAQILVDKEVELNAKRKENNWRQGDISAMISKLKAGDVKGFTTALAQLAGIEPKTAAQIVSDAGGEALALTSKAIGADRSQFTSIFLQLDYKRHGRARPLSHIETISKMYDDVPTQRAKSAIAMWNAHAMAQAA